MIQRHIATTILALMASFGFAQGHKQKMNSRPKGTDKTSVIENIGSSASTRMLEIQKTALMPTDERI
jgi:hypothetical protein